MSLQDALLAGTLPSPPHGTSADIRPSPDVGESSIVEQPLLEEEPRFQKRPHVKKTIMCVSIKE
eukprot:5285074-Amphidinium_carterae.1